MHVVDLSTERIGQICHELDTMDTGAPSGDHSPPLASLRQLRPPDRDGTRRPLQPGEMPQDAVIPWPSTTTKNHQTNRPWFVPFYVMPNMNGHGELFDRWEALVLELVNHHRIPGTPGISDLARAHQVLPCLGTRSFGKDLH